MPVSTPVPTPTTPHSLRVRLVLSWTWSNRTTWLHKAAIGHFPAHTRLTVRCTGRGCGRHATRAATGRRGVRRLLRRLTGRHYRAGDVLHITLTSPGFLPERARVIIREGRKPRIRG